MLTIRSDIHVPHLTGQAIYNFLIHPSDRAYQAWWPGTHLEFHLLRLGPNHIGDEIYMDEWIGGYRLKMAAVVVEAAAGRKIVWQIKMGLRLPVWLTLTLADDGQGVALTHTIQAGFSGVGRIGDPLLRLYFSDRFARAMDEHAQAEFPRLGVLLAAAKAGG